MERYRELMKHCNCDFVKHPTNKSKAVREEYGHYCSCNIWPWLDQLSDADLLDFYRLAKKWT
jgi:hypothetical protein